MYRAYKYFKTIAYQWLLAIIKNPDAVKDIIFDAIEFISKFCIKQKRRGHKLPFEILEEISNNDVSNPFQTGTYALN
ncbi:MAG: hypothetical protein HUU50_01950 [Candidatus Brocadiae bacterium]|nr:hypothetical protein [Candidatus Brocadiia bacterium]